MDLKLRDFSKKRAIFGRNESNQNKNALFIRVIGKHLNTFKIFA